MTALLKSVLLSQQGTLSTVAVSYQLNSYLSNRIGNKSRYKRFRTESEKNLTWSVSHLEKKFEFFWPKDVLGCRRHRQILPLHHQLDFICKNLYCLTSRTCGQVRGQYQS